MVRTIHMLEFLQDLKERFKLIQTIYFYDTLFTTCLKIQNFILLDDTVVVGTGS